MTESGVAVMAKKAANHLRRVAMVYVPIDPSSRFCCATDFAPPALIREHLLVLFDG